jgi:type I restriction enzyme, S subunit
VSIVDEAFEGIDRAIVNTKKNLTNARELFESYLNTIFTQKYDEWEEKPVCKISEVISGHSFKSSDFSDTNTLKSIKITNVGVREFIIESNSYLPEVFSKTYDKVAIPKGSIVIALTRSIISTGLKVAVVPEDYHYALLNQRVAAIKVDPSLISEQFLFSYLCTRKVVAYVQSQVNTLMQPNLSINDLRNMLVPTPSLEQQNQIVLKLEALSTETQRLEAIYQQKLAALNELKQSILQKAFTGELTADTTAQATKTAKETIAA